MKWLTFQLDKCYFFHQQIIVLYPDLTAPQVKGEYAITLGSSLTY